MKREGSPRPKGQLQGTRMMSPGGRKPGGGRKTAEIMPRTADEIDWKRRLNPDNVFDELPQPFRFINKCLQNLILTPVFEKIIEIESKKKRADYEGNLRQIYPSGTLDIEGVTRMEGDPYHPHSMISSSFAPKLPNGRPHTPTTTHHAHSSKVAIGDKRGQIILIDVGRKIILNRQMVFQGSRIEELALHSQKWGDMLVTTLVAAPRDSPRIKVFYYKSTDYKLIEAYEIELPVVEGAKGYEGMVRSLQISRIGDFLAITRYNGEVFVLRLPELPDPVNLPGVVEPQSSPSETLGVPGGPNTSGSNTTMIENYIETDLAAKFPEPQKIALEKWMVLRIEGKQLCRKFEDPYVVDPDAVEEERKRKEKEEKELAAAAAEKKGAKAPPKGTPVALDVGEEDEAPDHFTMGQVHKDSQDGDAGALLFPSKSFSIPELYFTHALVVGKLRASDSEQSLSKRLVTCNLYVVYHGLPSIDVYQLQNADMKAVRSDFTYEACAQRINAFRKANEKSPNKEQSGSTLLTVVRQIAQKKQEVKKESPALPVVRNPLRTFTLPYYISASTFVMLNESHQWLGVGLTDGSIVIIDSVLAVQKYFLPKHGKAVSSLAFYSNVSVLSGAEDGIVHIYDIRGSGDDEGIDTPNKVGTVVYKGNNTMDQKYPIVRCCVSEAGLGVVTDLMGNARVYDLIRFAKVCKLAPFVRHAASSADQTLHDTWRFLPRVCFHIQRDIMTAVAQKPAALFIPSTNEEEEPSGSLERSQFSEAPLLQLNCAEEMKTPSGIEYTHYNNITEILEKKYTPGKPFYLPESMVYIFKLEEIIQQLYPQIMSLMKYQKNFKECFWRFDPKTMEVRPPKTGGLSELDAGLPGSSRRTGDQSFQVSGQISKVEGRLKSSLKKKGDRDYQIRIAGQGVSPEPQKQSPGLSRFSPKFEEGANKLKKGTLTDKSLSSEFMTNRETFADNSTSVTVKSGSVMGTSSPKFQQPTLQMLNPQLFSKSVKAKNLIKNVEFESIRNVKERHSYHEHRQVRVQKRQEEIAKELEQKKQEEIAKQRREQLKLASLK